MEVSGTNISMIRGDTESITVAVEDAVGVAIPLVAGDKVYFTVKESTDTDVKILQKLIEVFDAGKAVIPILPADTKTLEADSHVYDIQIIWADGRVKTVVPPSQFNLGGDVTYE